MRTPVIVALLPLLAAAELPAQNTGANAPVLFSDPTGQLGPAEFRTSRPMINPGGAYVAYYNGVHSIGGTATYELVVRRVSDRATQLRQDLTQTNQLANPTRFTWGQSRPGDFPYLFYTLVSFNGPRVVWLAARSGNTGQLFIIPTASFVDLQRRPCGNLLAGVAIIGNGRQIWTMDTTNFGNTPVMVGAPVTTGGVVVWDVDPTESTLLAAEYSFQSNTAQLFLMSLNGVRTNLTTVSNLRGAGFGDTSNTVIFAHTPAGSTRHVLTRLDGSVATDLSDGTSEGFIDVFVQPAHLRVNQGNKDWIAYGGNDALAPFADRDRLGMMPLQGGGDTIVYRSTQPDSVFSPSIDRDGTQLVFEDGSRDDIMLATVGEEIRVSPTGSPPFGVRPGTAINVSNPTTSTQLAALFVNLSLQLPVALPPVLGFLWVNGPGITTVYLFATSPAGSPIVTPFTVPNNPSFVGLELDYQGIDLDTSDGTLTFTRPTRTRIL